MTMYHIVFFCSLRDGILYNSYNSHITSYSLMILLDGKGSTCMDIDLHATSDTYKWQLGPCQFSLKYSKSSLKYTEKCCVPNGDHLFSCKSGQSSGWDNGVVKIGRHQFCDDSVGFNQLTTINIPGRIAGHFHTNTP